MLKNGTALPILDESALRRLSGYSAGEQSLIAALFKAFEESTSQSLDAFKSAAKEKDATAFSLAAHRLKSTCSTLGLSRLEFICEGLEKNKGIPTDVDSILDQLKNELTAAQNELFKSGLK